MCALGSFPDQHNFASPSLLVDSIAQNIVERISNKFSRTLEIEQELVTAILSANVSSVIRAKPGESRFTNPEFGPLLCGGQSRLQGKCERKRRINITLVIPEKQKAAPHRAKLKWKVIKTIALRSLR